MKSFWGETYCIVYFIPRRFQNSVLSALEFLMQNHDRLFDNGAAHLKNTTFIKVYGNVNFKKKKL